MLFSFSTYISHFIGYEFIIGYITRIACILNWMFSLSLYYVLIWLISCGFVVQTIIILSYWVFIYSMEKWRKIYINSGNECSIFVCFLIKVCHMSTPLIHFLKIFKRLKLRSIMYIELMINYLLAFKIY